MVKHNTFLVSNSIRSIRTHSTDIHCCTAPSGYPQNVTVRQFNESSVLVQWLPPPVDQRNGLITAYQVLSSLFPFRNE